MKGLKPTGPAAPEESRRQQQEGAATDLVPVEASSQLDGQEGRKDHMQLPRKKQKGRGGSQEEGWHQEILDKGRVTCPVCRAVVRKTVEGLKKHMANCQQEMFTCHHCGKQLRSLAGMKYHLMADHNSLMMGNEESQMGQESERDSLRRMLKHMRKLRCPREGCTGSFTSILGYLYHTQKCGKAGPELEKLALRCPHCGKTYRSKAGLVYHLKSEHGPPPFFKEGGGQAAPTATEAGSEPSGGGSNGSSRRGKVQRKSAKVAAYYLQELASQERAKEWPKRKVLRDLVPDDRKLKYTRPGMPAVSKEVLCKWKSQIKGCKRVPCPNQGCACAYSSIAGLKSHLGSCSLGEFVAGKYQCLLCEKEFVSESGVKYHINTVHAEDWFDSNTSTTRSFEKQMKQQQQQQQKTPATAAAAQKRQQKRRLSSRSRKRGSKKTPPEKPPRTGQSQQQEEEEDRLRGRQPS